MSHYDTLPRDFESIVELPRGSLWLYHAKRIVGGVPMEPEYRIHVVEPQVARLVRSIKGVAPSAIYYRNDRKVGFDFICQSVAMKEVIEVLLGSAEGADQ